jgi:uncharacterized protein YggE
MKKFLLTSVLLTISTFFCIWASGTKDQYDTVSISGTGIVKMQSDAANITLAVVTNDEDPSRAAEKNAQIMVDVQNAVSVLGMKKEDIVTQNYSLYENYRYAKDGTMDKPDYRASNSVTITVYDISLAGIVIDAALKAGANQLSQISFFSTKSDEAYDEARSLAIENAYKKADFLAKETGRTLGKVIKIEEAYNAPSQNIMYKTDMLAEGRASTPINPEDSVISVTYNFVYELK